ncbi:MAG: tripartite tricarboxylate transporter substrate binding protein [Betaproteobacteria bacterium]|nr:tripartite tricarboxylate transporter substrate binding protein [Betaproteobacteria bacterium]
MRLIAVIAVALACATGVRAEDSYPNKPVRLIVPFAPGSLTDAVARVIGHELGKRLGQNVIVDTRPGANGQLGASFAAKSPPDGYTIMATTNTPHAANVHLYKKLPYDPVKDFIPVARIGTIPFMLVVNPSLPVKNVEELIAYARANPGKLTYGTSNSTSLVSAETINVMAKVSTVGVQYKASQQAIIDLISGEIHMMICDFAVSVPQVKSGKLRALAVPMRKRTALMPELPPIGETLKGFEFTPWIGIVAPAGTPKAVTGRLSKELLSLLALPEMSAKLASVGVELAPMPPAPFGTFMQEEINHWGRLVKAAGIQPE